MADHLIQYRIFSIKHDGAFDFSINQVFFVNKPVTENIEIAPSGNTGLNSALLMSLFIPAIQIMETHFSKKMPKIANPKKRLFNQSF